MTTKNRASHTLPNPTVNNDPTDYEAIALFFATDAPDELPWHHEALCAQTDPETFFPEKGSSTRAAKMVCDNCPVADACLANALSNNEEHGVWGGLNPTERLRLRRIAGTPVDFMAMPYGTLRRLASQARMEVDAETVDPEDARQAVREEVRDLIRQGWNRPGGADGFSDDDDMEPSDVDLSDGDSFEVASVAHVSR